MSVHNGGPLLCETVESVLGQSLPDFEFIIVDDGSDDDTVGIIRAYNDARVRLIEAGRLANVAACRNLAMAAAQAEWIAHIDADDPAHPRRLEILWATAQRAEGYAAIGSRTRAVYGDDRVTWSPNTLPADPPVIDVTRRLLAHNPIGCSSVLGRKKAYLEVRGFDPAQGVVSDYWLWAKLAQAGWKIGRVDAELQAKRIHAGQHFENKKRLAYLRASAKVQIWVGVHVFGIPAWAMWLPAGTRMAYGLLPQRWRTRLRHLQT